VHPADLPRVSVNWCCALPGKVTGVADMPKLFDERRTGQRVTKNMVVRLIPKDVVVARRGSTTGLCKAKSTQRANTEKPTHRQSAI